MRKPNRPKGPQNLMHVCTDCGAGFRNISDAAKLDRHCFNAGGAGTSHGGKYGLHHGFRTKNSKSKPNPYDTRYPWRTVEIMEELDGPYSIW